MLLLNGSCEFSWIKSSVIVLRNTGAPVSHSASEWNKR